MRFGLFSRVFSSRGLGHDGTGKVNPHSCRLDHGDTTGSAALLVVAAPQCRSLDRAHCYFTAVAVSAAFSPAANVANCASVPKNAFRSISPLIPGSVAFAVNCHIVHGLPPTKFEAT